MGEAITYAVELAVGLAVLGLGVATWRSRRRRALAAAFVVAGLAASVHALVELAR